MKAFLTTALLLVVLGCDTNSFLAFDPPQAIDACPPEGGPVGSRPDLFSSIDHSPSWSPDGRRIAYLHERGYVAGEGLITELWTYDIATNQARRNVDKTVWDFDWLSDNEFVATLPDRDLHVITDQGDYVQPLTEDGNQNWYPDISLDGERLTWDKGYSTVWTLDFQTGVQLGVPRPDSSGDWRSPRWSPDSRRIAHIRYVDGPDAQGSVHTMDPDGSNVERVTSRIADHREPAWSPVDEDIIAYSAKGCQWLYDVFVHDLRTGQTQRVTFNGGHRPTWSPDGRSIAYSRSNVFAPAGGAHANHYLHVIDLETGEERAITSPETYAAP